MPIWNEELQQWGYSYFEEVIHFEWLGLERKMISATFAYHKPSASGLEKINKLRESYTELSSILNIIAPPSRELSVALTNLEQSAMWAIKAVVHNDPASEVDTK